MASPFDTVNGPTGASYKAPNLAALLYQGIGGLPNDYFQGTQQGRTLQMQKPILGPDGQPSTDFNTILQELLKRGGGESAQHLLPTLIDLSQQQQFYDQLRRLGGGGGDQQPVNRSPPVGQDPNVLTRAAASQGSRPEVMPSSRVWGDREAEAAGLYEPRTRRGPISSAEINQGSEVVGSGGGPVGGVGGSPISPAPTSGAGGSAPSYPGARGGGGDLQRQIDHADTMAERYNTLAAAPKISPPQAAAARAEAERWTNVSKQLRENLQLTEREKNYRAGARPGESLVDFETRSAREKSGAEKEAANVGETMEKLALEGIEARGHGAQLDTIQKLGERVGYGVVPKVQSFLGHYGIDTKGLSDIQAYERSIDFMAPQLRPIGSGRLLQNELNNFKASLGGLMTTPEGRRVSIENLKLISQYKEAIGQIASDQRIPINERMTRIYSLPPPHLKTLDDVRGTTAEAGPGQAAQLREGATATNPKTGQRIILRGGQWVPAQ